MDYEIYIDFLPRKEGSKSEYCIICDEKITSPLCTKCIAKGFKDWTRKFPNKTQKYLSREADKYLSEHKGLDRESVCISCGRRSVAICPDCFVDYLYQKCLQARLDSSNLKEFLLMFNFATQK